MTRLSMRILLTYDLVQLPPVPKAGTRFDRRAFDEYARLHLEVHKRPKVVAVVPGPLPRNPLGKLLRRVLREQHLGGEPRAPVAGPDANPR